MNDFYIEYTTLQLYNISKAIQERLEKLNKLLQKQAPVVDLLYPVMNKSQFYHMTSRLRVINNSMYYQCIEIDIHIKNLGHAFFILCLFYPKTYINTFIIYLQLIRL